MRRMAMMAVLAGAVLLVANEKPEDRPDFTYAYPPQARAIPKLRAWLDADAHKLHAEFDAGQASDRAAQTKSGFPFNRWSADYDWKIVTDTPRFLSLSQTQWQYSGGAHGNTEFDALLWDKAAAAKRDPRSLFVSEAALETATRDAFCRRLNAERREKRGDELANLPEFERCDKPFGTVILGSSTHTRFDRIGFLIAPYDAGPYVEGTYEVTLPVTSAIIAAVKPEWRGYFAVGKSRGTP